MQKSDVTAEAISQLELQQFLSDCAMAGINPNLTPTQIVAQALMPQANSEVKYTYIWNFCKTRLDSVKSRKKWQLETIYRLIELDFSIPELDLLQKSELDLHKPSLFWKYYLDFEKI